MTVHIPLRCMGCKHQELTQYQKPCSDCWDYDLYTLIEQEKKPTKAYRIRAMSEMKMDEVILCDICESVCSDDFWIVGLDNGFTAEFCPRCHRKSVLDRLNDEVE